MSNMYINLLEVVGNEKAHLAHSMTIKRLCLNNKRNPREHQEFNTPSLLNAFIPGCSSHYSQLSSSQLGCEIAYVDDRLEPGTALKILSKGGVPYGLQEIYLNHLFKLDPKVIVSMYTYTCQPNEEWLCRLALQAGVICQV